MRNTLIYGGYGCGVWTSAIANDFVFENNVIANSQYAWISQLDRDQGQQELGAVEIKNQNQFFTKSTIVYLQGIKNYRNRWRSSIKF